MEAQKAFKTSSYTGGSLYDLYNTLESTGSFADKASLLGNFIFWIHGNSALPEHRKHEFTRKIVSWRVAKLHPYFVPYYTNLMMDALHPDEQKTKMLELIQNGLSLAYIELDQFTRDIHHRLSSRVISKMDAHEAVDIIHRFEQTMSSFQAVFENAKSQSKLTSEHKNRMLHPVVEVLEGLLDLKAIHPELSERVDNIFSEFYQIFIENMVLQIPTFYELDFISERIIKEGFVLRNARFDYANLSIEVCGESLLQLKTLVETSNQGFAHFLSEAIMQSCHLAFKKDGFTFSRLTIGESDLYPLLPLENPENVNLRTHAAILPLATKLAVNSHHYGLLAILNEYKDRIPTSSRSYVFEGMINYLIKASPRAETPRIVANYLRSLSESNLSYDTTDPIEKLKVQSFSENADEFGAYLTSLMEENIIKHMKAKLLLFLNKFVNNKGSGNSPFMKSMGENSLRLMLDRDIPNSKYLELYNKMNNINDSLKLEEHYAPLYFNFFKRYITPNFANRMVKKYIRKMKKIEFPENYKKRHNILKKLRAIKESASDPFSDFQETPEKVTLPKINVLDHQSLIRHYPYFFRLQWVKDRASEKMFEYFILNQYSLLLTD